MKNEIVTERSGEDTQRGEGRGMIRWKIEFGEAEARWSNSQILSRSAVIR
jgi:hypothetical protein